MKTVTVKSGVLIGSLAVLAGCGGGGTTAPVYKSLNEAIAASGTTEAPTALGGVALRSNGTTGALDITTITGEINYSTGVTSVGDGTLTVSDSTGFSATGVLTDGTTTLSQINTPISTSAYNYVIAYSEPYSSGGVSYDSTGFVGVVTATADVQAAQNATYTGAADVTVTNGGSAQHLANGTSSLSANFAAGTADLTLNGFTAANSATVDTITATGMTISGSGFSGGTVLTKKADSTVNVTGTPTTSSVSGTFFGYNAATSAPAEMAGVLLINGPTGTVTGAFIGK
jgi:hypothetical protein